MGYSPMHAQAQRPTCCIGRWCRKRTHQRELLYCRHISHILSEMQYSNISISFSEHCCSDVQIVGCSRSCQNFLFSCFQGPRVLLFK